MVKGKVGGRWKMEDGSHKVASKPPNMDALKRRAETNVTFKDQHCPTSLTGPHMHFTLAAKC